MSPESSSRTERAAQNVRSHPAFRVLARAGFAANGVVHILIGVIVLAIAPGGGESDQTGAFRAVASAPLGSVALWVLVIGLAALGLWYLVDGLLTAEDDTRKRWTQRIVAWATALVYAALAFSAGSVALGSGSSGDQSAQAASSAVLALPAGPALLGAAGVGIVVIGGVFVAKGVTRSFRKKLRMPDGTAGRVVTVLGVIGYIAKGASLAIVGVLVVTAAVRVEPDAAGGLDGAIGALTQLPFGPWLVGAVGIGFLAYGIYCFFRARYARL